MVLQMVQKMDAQSEVDFYTRCMKVARAKGYSQAVWEDFPSWAYERMKLSGSTRVDLLLIDYLRVTYGVTGSDGQKLRKALNTASDNSVGLEQVLACDGSSPDARMVRDELWALAEGQDKEMLMLYFCDGRSKKEIGELFGVTEARISQRMKAVLVKMRKTLEGG